MGVRISIDTLKVRARLDKAWKNALPALSEQILTDCNYFVRADQWVLKASSIIGMSKQASVPVQYSAIASEADEQMDTLAKAEGSHPEKGILTWDTPYAKKVYYTGSPSHDSNPNASLQWCEKAKATYGKDWTKLANKLFKEGLT